MIWIIVWNFRKLFESSANQSDPLGFSKSRIQSLEVSTLQKKVGPNGFIFRSVCGVTMFENSTFFRYFRHLLVNLTWHIFKIKKNPSVYTRVFPNDGTPKTPQNDEFLVGKPMFVPGTTILGNPHQGNSFFFCWGGRNFPMANGYGHGEGGRNLS